MFIGDDLDILPRDLSSPARLEGFQKCLFRGKTSGIRLGRGCSFRIAIRSFSGGENTLTEPRCSFKRFCDTINFDDVDANGNDHEKYE